MRIHIKDTIKSKNSKTMKRYLLIIITSLISAMILPTSSREQVLSWVKEMDTAAWKPRDSQGEFVFKNQLWILGGWDTPQTPNFLDVWKSLDGKKWINTTKAAPWVQSDLPVSLAFKNKIWIMGGRKVPGSVCSNKVWSSSDGAKWDLVTAEANWSPRLGAGFAVFKGRMWILGGTSDFYHNNDTTLMNDVWSSADGKEWRLELQNAPWSKRAYGQVVVFDNKIWMIGGGQRFPKVVVNNDVWCSEDGKNWKEVTKSASWLPRIWFSSVVYRDRIWVLGGWSDEHKNFADVWNSKDGIDWKELKTELQWSKRHELSAFVLNGKIWVAAGAAGEDYALNSEVWSLFIPPKWFNQNETAD